MNSSPHDLHDRFCASLGSLRDSLGQEAVVMLGVLLAAGVVIGILMWLWILRGGLSDSLHRFSRIAKPLNNISENSKLFL